MTSSSLGSRRLRNLNPQSPRSEQILVFEMLTLQILPLTNYSLRSPSLQNPDPQSPRSEQILVLEILTLKGIALD